MKNEPFEKIFSDSLHGEIRAINANVFQQKPLAKLLTEPTSGVQVKDGSVLLFKRKELKLLAGFLNEEEQKQLMLPILIEVIAGENYIAVIACGPVDLKVVEHIVGMPMRLDKGRIKLEKPQLAVFRQNLRTTTQYLFSPKMIS